MRWQSLTTVAASLLLSAACTGGLEPVDGPNNPDDPGQTGEPGDGEGAARALFDGLHGQMMLECQACHLGINDEASIVNGPDFLGAETDVDSVYTYLLQAESPLDGAPLVSNSPANSKLYFYGSLPHTGSLGMSDELAAQVEEWIIAEAEEDGITPEPEPETPEEPEEPGDPEDPGTPSANEPRTVVQALEMFAACMRYDDFVAGDFPDIANIDTNNNDGRCRECHGLGESGAFLNQDDALFYKGQRSLDENGRLGPAVPGGVVGLYSFVGAQVQIDGTIEIIQTKRYELKRNNNGNHPNYNFGGYIDDVDAFYQATYERYRLAIESGVPCIPDNPQ